jgi:hypothetical protein
MDNQGVLPSRQTFSADSGANEWPEQQLGALQAPDDFSDPLHPDSSILAGWMNADVKFHQNYPALPHDDGNGHSRVSEFSSPHIVPTTKEQFQDVAMAEQYRSDMVSSYGNSRTILSDELFRFNTNPPPHMNVMLSSRL